MTTFEHEPYLDLTGDQLMATYRAAAELAILPEIGYPFACLQRQLTRISAGLPRNFDTVSGHVQVPYSDALSATQDMLAGQAEALVPPPDYPACLQDIHLTAIFTGLANLHHMQAEAIAAAPACPDQLFEDLPIL